MAYDVAVIGTGEDPENPSAEGFAMAYAHADAYERLDDAEVVACADIVPENAAAFARAYGIDDENVFEDYAFLLDEVEPDVVSVTVPPAIHAEIVIDCVRSAGVRAVHCEKPMARTWGESRRMAQEAHRNGVELTFNHQRRFGTAFRRAKALLDDGEIGALKRVEFSAHDVYDYGSHSFDLSNYFNDEVPPAWVLANVDYREENVLFGAHNENHAVVQWQYENGVDGLATTGYGSSGVGCHNRLIGSEGVIEVGPSDDPAALRVRRDGEGWETTDADGEGLHDGVFIDRAIEDVVAAIDAPEPSELAAKHALNATELCFGAWESARRRGRVKFPLEIDDNPLESMVESGELEPEPADD